MGRTPRRNRRADRRGATPPLPCWLLFVCLLGACSSGTPTAANASPTTATSPTSATATLPPTPPTAIGAFARTATSGRPPAATATRTTQATATRAASTTPERDPAGQIPAGWRTYRGALPFTMAVPPGWTVEEQTAQGLIYFYAPVTERTIFLVLATTGRATPNPNLDVLRDQWFRSRTTSCRRFAVEQTDQARYAAIDFATVGATCDLPTGLAYSYTGIGLRQQTPWIFEFNAPYGDFAQTRAVFFEPMIRSWTFDGTPNR